MKGDVDAAAVRDRDVAFALERVVGEPAEIEIELRRVGGGDGEVQRRRVTQRRARAGRGSGWSRGVARDQLEDAGNGSMDGNSCGTIWVSGDAVIFVCLQ